MSFINGLTYLVQDPEVEVEARRPALYALFINFALPGRTLEVPETLLKDNSLVFQAAMAQALFSQSFLPRRALQSLEKLL